MKSIDLHGIKHVDVQRILDVFFWEMIQKNHLEVRVITGWSDSMKNIVRLVCKDYNFKVEEEIYNKGSLIIKMR
jgi:DNA-nicking Smr family endonuclease